MSSDRHTPITTPSAMQEHNQRQVLELLWAGGPLSRTQIANHTGLSKTTARFIMSRLAEDGLIRNVCATGPRKPGPVSVFFEAEPASGYARCIEVDGGKIRVSIVDLAGNVVASHERASSWRSPGSLIRAVLQCADHATTQAGLQGDQVLATVIGSPATPPKCTVDLPRHTRLYRDLQAAFGDAVVLENRTRLTTIGERAAGAAYGCDTVVCLVADVDVSMGIVLNGRLLTGFTESAGKISAMPVAGRRHSGQASTNRLSTLRQSANTEAVVSAAITNGLSAVSCVDDVFRLARAGDARALRVVDTEAGLLAFAIASITAILDPEIVVLSGAIGSHADLLADPINQALSPLSPFIPKIVAGSLGSDAVMTGARAVGVRAARSAILDRRRILPC